MKAMDTASLLNEIVALGLDLLCRPAMDFEARRERCRLLEARLDAEIKTSSFCAPYLDNFAPLLLQAIRQSLAHWGYRDEHGGQRWDGLVGHLIAEARVDSGAVIEAVRDAARSEGGG
jgi:hypothetical protein